MEQIQPDIKWSEEHTIDLIRKLRNDLIKDFLDERNLISWFSTQYNLRELSAARIEFLKRDLKEKLIEPVDVKHYHELIQQINKQNSASISEKFEPLFLKDIEPVLKRHTF
jgi:hypothetical protein